MGFQILSVICIVSRWAHLSEWAKKFFLYSLFIFVICNKRCDVFYHNFDLCSFYRYDILYVFNFPYNLLILILYYLNWFVLVIFISIIGLGFYSFWVVYNFFFNEFTSGGKLWGGPEDEICIMQYSYKDLNMYCKYTRNR